LEPGYKKNYDQWWWMRVGVKKTSFFSRHIVPIMYIKDPILAMMLVMGHNTPVVQLGSILVLKIIMVLLFLIYEPFVAKLPNYLEIANYLLFAIITSLFFVQTFDS
jgi:hypothetical protein